MWLVFTVILCVVFVGFGLTGLFGCWVLVASGFYLPLCVAFERCFVGACYGRLCCGLDFIPGVVVVWGVFVYLYFVVFRLFWFTRNVAELFGFRVEFLCCLFYVDVFSLVWFVVLYACLLFL